MKFAKKDNVLTIAVEMEFAWKESVIVLSLTLDLFVMKGNADLIAWMEGNVRMEYAFALLHILEMIVLWELVHRIATIVDIAWMEHASVFLNSKENHVN